METPKEELIAGPTFAGRYQIIEELGKGGIGKVYKVLDLWKYAAPGIAEVEDARKRRARLKDK